MASVFPTVEAFKAFTQRLMNHDWYYSFSDDHRVYTNGAKSSKQLEEDAKVNSYFETAYKAYCDYISSNVRGSETEPVLRTRRDLIINALLDGLTFHHSFAPDADDLVFSKVPTELSMQRPQ